MKNFLVLIILTFCTLLPANAIWENVTNPENSRIKVSIWCTPNRKTCKIGTFTLRTFSKEPLYIEDNLVCTPSRKMCSDGTKSIRSSKPLF